MLIARWSIDARFGHKQEVIQLLRKWLGDIGTPAGFDPRRTRLLTGSVGMLEARVQAEHEIASLDELEKVWDAIGRNPAHQQWGKDLEPHVVSGTSRWEILRVL